MRERGAALDPFPELVCPVCAGGAVAELHGAAEIASQAERTRRFHRVRLRRLEHELEERARFTQEADVSLLACAGCEVLLRWPRPKSDELIETYSEERYPEARFEEMVAAQVTLYRKKIPLLRRLLGGSGRVLEVGSFLGGFLQVARTAGLEAFGVDPSHQLAQRVRGRGLEVFEGTLEGLAAERELGPVDAVVVWNTFDQLVEPRRVLAVAARLLRPAGVLAVRVPHGAGYRALLARLRLARGPGRRLFEACLAWNNLLSFPYLHGYGLPSLDRLILPSGFARVAVHGDVLCQLAGRASRGWARAEEVAVKQLQLHWIRLEERGSRRRVPPAPWLDVYYRRGPSGPAASGYAAPPAPERSQRR